MGHGHPDHPHPHDDRAGGPELEAAPRNPMNQETTAGDVP
jgi:hypothetical protein